ncbi:MAG: Rieske 2Fe-2S domain-containing protein [Acidobacteria bacterium]|nr:Rieske 2Fe-2S domain-containing protein [Acidobacteriota bacterium]
MSELLKYPGESSNNDLTPDGKAAAHTRRVFLFKLAVGLNVLVGAVLAVPLVGYIISPSLKKGSRTGAWIKIGDVNEFPAGETRLVSFRSPVAVFDDGQTGDIPCWVRHISGRKFQVFAINCAHLGCPVRWFAQAKLFLCPCHGGAYYEDGARAAGPPERGLFLYKHRLVGDSLVIHAGDMPTLATQASCKGDPLVQIQPANAASVTVTTANATESTSWQA